MKKKEIKTIYQMNDDELFEKQMYTQRMIDHYSSLGYTSTISSLESIVEEIRQEQERRALLAQKKEEEKLRQKHKITTDTITLGDVSDSTTKDLW